MSCSPRIVVALATVFAVPASAQTGGFVATLGKDTLHAERFTRSPGKIEGTIVTRSPITRIARWHLLLDSRGRPTRYEVRTTRADGTPDRTPGSNATLSLTGDTLIRETPGAEKPDTQRIAAPAQVVPGPNIPYVGVSYLMYEIAFADARTRANAAGESSIRLLTMLPRQVQTAPTRVWFVGPDSVELDYFGVVRSGYTLDRAGNLVRSDWSLTTYRYQIARVGDVNVERIAEGWAAADKAGAAMGALSPRDTARGNVGAVNITVDYSRPSKRGRKIWGEVVPWDKVWRLGADFATHVVFSSDARVGDIDIPAGTYTLWMLPSAAGESKLVVNKAVRIFGTNYNPSNDLVRIPLRREGKAIAERLTISVSDGRLRIHWDDAEYSVAVAPKPPGPQPSSAYLALLPDGAAKRQFIIDCTGCHLFDASQAYPNGAARDHASWKDAIDRMYARFTPGAGFPIIADPVNPDTLASWLAHNLTPHPAPPHSEPRSASSRVREYLIPQAQDLPHDAIVDDMGRVIVTGMFSAQMYVLDTVSGRFTTEPIPVPNANPRAHHVDYDGTWWVLLGGPGMIAQYSQMNGRWSQHEVGMYGHSVARDTSGVWVNGHFTGHPAKLKHVHAKSGQITTVDLPSATRPGVSPIPYELRTGPDGKIWMSELHGGRVISYDPATKAIRNYEMPIPQSGPRRLDVAQDGKVWIPLYAGGELVELDPATGAMQRYPIPEKDALPYVVRVDDARDAVWVGTAASDAVYRFDRKTRQFETIVLPSRGALVRHLDIDRRTGDVWAAYGVSPGNLSARIARIRGK